MKNVEQVRQQRRDVVQAMQKLLADNQQTWGPAQQSQYDAGIAAIDSCDNDLQHIADLQNRMVDKYNAERGMSAGGWNDAQGRRVHVLTRDQQLSALPDYGDRTPFGFGEYVASMVRGTQNPDIRAALSEGTDSAGGFTVPDVLMRQLIDRMRAKTVVVRAGALTVPLDTEKTSIARLASDPAASWRLENAAVGESDPTFESVSFTARSLAVLVKISRELLDDSINVEEALMNAFAGALAVETDRVALFGTGTAPEPRGLFNTTGVGSVSMGVNGAQLTNYAKVLDSMLELQNASANDPTALVMAPRTWRTLAGLTDTTGQPLTAPPAVSAIPQLVSTQVPVNQTQGTAVNASPILTGDFTQLLLGVRQQLRVDVLKETFASNLQFGFLAHLRLDIAVAQPGAFAKLIGIIP